jgi:hypothetical protein
MATNMMNLDPADTGQDYGIGLPGKSGILDKIKSVMKNKMFAQFLSAAGADISETGNLGKNLNSAVQGDISSQNYAKMMQRILAGQMPGVNASIDDKGLSFKVARETPVGSPGPDPGTTGVPMLTPSTPNLQNEQNQGQFNPFQSGQLNFSASDLAGLTPEMMQSVINDKLSMEQMRQKSMNDLYEHQRQALNDASERAYRQQLIKQSEAQISNYQSEDQRRQEESQIAWFKAQKESTPADLQMYQYDVENNGFKGSLKEWRDKIAADPTEQRNYELAKSQGFKGTFFDYQLALKKAGGVHIDLGTQLAEKAGMNRIEKESYLGSDKFETDIDKHITGLRQSIMNSIPTKNAQGKPLSDAEYEAAESKATAEKKKEFIEQYVQNNKGTIVNEQLVGKDLVFVIRWEAITDKSGKVVRPAKTESFTYGIFE